MVFSRPVRRLLLVSHVATAVGWLGAEAVMLALDAAGLAGSDPRAVYPASALTGTVLILPLSLLALTTGVVGALGSRWGLLRHWWVLTKLASTTVMTGLVLLVLLPKLRAAGADPAALTAPDRRQLVIAPSVACSLLLLNVILSVYRPWGRLRRRPVPNDAGARQLNV